MSFTYWPYDEVSINTSNDELTIKTPWMSASTPLEIFDQENILQLKSKLNDKTAGINDMPLISDFFGHFHKYPLAYILPQNKDAQDVHKVLDQRLLPMNFLQILNETKEESFGEQVLKNLPRTTFEWDQEAALDFASINGLVHPESLFSIARRYHILELLSHDQGHEVFTAIDALKGEEKRAALASLVRQNHYVTERCQEALKPALDIAQNAKKQIAEFMEAERGHDKILNKALVNLSYEPSDIAVSPETKILMGILKYLASRNFLAFAMAIDAFERNSYEDADPIAKLLANAGFDKSADFINLHMKINDEGEHDNVAMGFLEPMSLCDRDYALEALKLMEVLSVVMTTITKSVLKP